MGGLFLDENLSPRVAHLLSHADPPVPADSAFDWEGGRLLNTPDEQILEAIAPHRLILVTYDRKTIVPILNEWGQLGIEHAGVVFVTSSAIPSSDFGGLVRALADLWREEGALDWTNRSTYLRPPAS